MTRGTVSKFLCGGGSFHHVLHEAGRIGQLGKAQVDALLAHIHQTEEVNGGAVIFQAALGTIRKMQEHISGAGPDTPQELLFVGNQKKLHHKQ